MADKLRFRMRYVLAVPDRGAKEATRNAADTLQVPSSSSRLILPSEVSARASSYATATPIDEILPPWPGANVAVIPWASEIRWDEPAATSVTMTRSAWVTERHEGGFRVRGLSISGDLGPLPYSADQSAAMQALTLLQANGAERGTAYTSLRELNPDAFDKLPEAFRTLLDAYALVERVAMDSALELHLYSIDEGRFYLVEPLRKAQIRAARNRCGWHYDFVFQALAPVRPPKIVAVQSAMPVASLAAKNWFENTLAAVKSAVAAVDAVISKIRGAFQTAESYVRRVAEAAQSVANTLADAAQTLGYVTHLPIRVLRRLERVVGSFRSAWMDLRDALFLTGRAGGGSDSTGDAISPLPSSSSAPVRDALALAYAADDAMASALATMRLGALAFQATSRTMTIRRGDTIRDLAAEIMGDASYWRVLADMNNLRAPYVADSRPPGAMGPGDKLVLPADTQGTTGSLADPEVSTEERLYGRGIRLDADGDWQAAADLQGVATVAGVACAEQGLRVRCETEIGTNLLFPSLGLPPVLGEENTETSSRSYGVAVMWQLNRDDRVARVRDLAVVDNGNTLEPAAIVDLIGTEQVAVGDAA